MLKPLQYHIPLSEVIFAVSRAIDLVDPSLNKHNEKVAFVALSLAQELGYSTHNCLQVAYAALLHDIGSMHITIPLAENGSFDRAEQSFPKHAFWGAYLLENCSSLAFAANMVKYHHAPWKKIENRVPVLEAEGAQIIQLADIFVEQTTANLYSASFKMILVDTIKTLSKKTIRPDIVDHFLHLLSKEAFWLAALQAHKSNLKKSLLHGSAYSALTWDELNEVAHFFSFLIDMRSHFTASHSASVAIVAKNMAILSGFSNREVEEIMVAGYFHDIGKVAVPVAILEKPGPLSDDEMLTMQGHTYYTREVLNEMSGLDKITSWAADHHETISGNGYPYCIEGNDLSSGARLMAVADIFTAILEDRPYRKGMTRKKAMAVLYGAVANNKICSRKVDLVNENFDLLFKALKDTEEKSQDRFTEFWAKAVQINPKSEPMKLTV